MIKDRVALKCLFAFCLLLTISALASAQGPDYARWVNPFIGTGGHGHTFPGATTPFGMVQLSPDTRTDNWDGSSGYHYSDDTIYGFSHTHLSGTGIPDYCDILLMPTIDERRNFSKLDPAKEKYVGFASTFDHTDEKAEPGYYSVRLDDKKLLAELTATPRVGLHRYTFPASGAAGIDLNLLWRDKVLESNIRVVSSTRVEGFRRSSSWARDQVIYFVAEFSKPFSGHGSGADPTRAMFFGFNTKDGEQILVKVAVSPVSVEGARKNLKAELPGWNFDKVRADARAAWNKELSKIEVSGGSAAQTMTFYTALYHTMIQPNIFNDVDGNYRGLDKAVHNIAETFVSDQSDRERPYRKGSRKVPPAAKSASRSGQYTVFSLWDTFRAAHPLYTIIDQRRTVDFINTFIRQYQQGGRLPVWELAGNETDCMIGYHAVSVIADAMVKGIKGFDYEKAYAAAKHSAELDRYGLAAYKKRGYISMEDENESVSKTLEYAYDDWCISQMASVLWTDYLKAHPEARKHILDDPYIVRVQGEQERYLRRARSYQNLFDPSTGFMRPKKNGGFVSPFAPNEVTFNFTEGNSWVYSFFVPQDTAGLIKLAGGPEKFAAKLDGLFNTSDRLTGREQPDITGLIGQYAHGNEPSHHIAYLYDFVGQPWKTQELARRIMDKFYKPAPDGLIGNEDCGQMSAWYVLSSSGFYEVTPGSGTYVLGTPLFPQITYHLENGKTFSIRAPHVSGSNSYIARATLNGVRLEAPSFQHEDLIKGGVLELEMSPTPIKDAFAHSPLTLVRSESPAVPVIGDGRRVFRDPMSVSITTITPDAAIYFTTDGSEPTNFSRIYKEPLRLSTTTKVRAVTITRDGLRSAVAEASFQRAPHDWTVNIASKYNRQYTGGGDDGLIDGIRGTTTFASGEWQGYQAQDFVATVDLKRETEIKKVGGGFLQSAGSWIWMPTHIVFEVSMDRQSFTLVADIKTDIPTTDMASTIRDYVQAISPTRARYVRVHAYNLGKIPSWHPGAGDDAFIFVDELIIN